jgi:8-oxo-dGTP pyrophosphatase MutT (NUDIX family)
MSTDDFEPAAALPSSTVLLVRAGKSDPEILMVLRRPGDAFGDSYTFPGGVVDNDEADAIPYCEGRTGKQANTILSLATGGLDFYSAAARELFEETGILLARDSSGDWAFSQESESHLNELRTQLDAGDLRWADLLRRHDLSIACDALHYVSFWETPIQFPRRWATRFFLAELPPGGYARHDGRELLNSRWMTAAAVLAAGSDGEMTLPFPTRASLDQIAPFRTLQELLNWGRDQAATGIARILPVVYDASGEQRVVVPGEPDYPPDGAQ